MAWLKDIYMFCRGMYHIPWWSFWQTLMVFMHGAWKHKYTLWCDLPYKRSDFEDKVDRHRSAVWHGIENDKETGRPHYAHATCDIMMLMRKYRGNLQTRDMYCLLTRTFKPEVLDK